MIAKKEVLDAIERVKQNGLKLSKTDFTSIIKASSEIAIDKQFIKNLASLLSISFQNSKIDKLTPREQQILCLIGEGKQNKIIAKELNLKVSTIETHRKNIRKKLELTGKGKLLEAAILFRFENYRDD